MNTAGVVAMFSDRTEAGRLLARALHEAMTPDALVLGIPRGGVIVAAEVARLLALDLDIVVVRKIGAPNDPEYAVGAVDENGAIIGGAYAGDDAYLTRAAAAAREEIGRRMETYRGDRARPRVAGRDVAVVDDGIATGLTVKAAVRSLRARGATRVIVAAPVASAEAARELAGVADDVIVLDIPDGFGAVGAFYRDFAQTTDAEVVAALREAWARK
jgi:predicted phosphoribosyltransferase